MNGLYSNYMGFPSAPRQNVQQYVNAPVMSVPAQSQQQGSLVQLLRAAQPQQTDFWSAEQANPLLHVAGQPQNKPQPVDFWGSEQASPLLHVAGVNNNQK